MEKVMVAKPSRLVLLLPMVAVGFFSVALYLRHFPVFQNQSLSKAAVQSPISLSFKAAPPAVGSQQTSLSPASPLQEINVGDKAGDSLLRSTMLRPNDLRP